MSEKRVLSQRKVRNLTAVAAVTVPLLVGYSAYDSKQNLRTASAVSRSAQPASPAETNTTVPGESTVDLYFVSARRNEKITRAVKGFGEQVLAASQNPDNPWAPFMTYCSHVTDIGIVVGGWLTKGEKLIPGSTCSIENYPPAGDDSAEVSTTVLVGRNGTYTDDFIGATVSDNSCYDMEATLIIGPNVRVWDEGLMDSQGEFIDTATTHSVAATRHIDNTIVDCLDRTSYK